MARLVLRCPICNRISLPRLSSHLKQEREGFDEGLVPILINNYVCDHLFIAYVDHHWQARQVIEYHENQENHPYRLMLVEPPMHSENAPLISGVVEAN